MKRRKFIQSSSIAATYAALGLYGCSKSLDTEILILGGGISGLSLAYQLEKAGREYILLEGSDRLGGRLFYHPQIKRDVGGRGVGDRYDHLMKIVKELDVPLKDITDYMRNPTAIYFEGKIRHPWPEDTPNPRMLAYQLKNEQPALAALEEWYQSPKMDIAYSEYLKKGGLTEQEIDLVNISANYNDVNETSALNALHSGAFRKFNGTTRIYNFEGGSHQFIRRIEEKLTHPIHLNSFVTNIKDQGNQVNVTCADGKKYSASKVVSTMPFSTLRNVDMSINTSANQKKAIDQLGYTNITQIHLSPKENFWELDELPIDMWTDTPLERLMKMNFEPDRHELVCWVNGTGTQNFDALSDREIEKYVLDKMAEIRPASEGKLEYVGTHKWGQYKYNKGAYAEFQVGQAAWFEEMIQPAGNIHFAGEHTARKSRGIEGAAESAVRVFSELIN